MTSGDEKEDFLDEMMLDDEGDTPKPDEIEKGEPETAAEPEATPAPEAEKEPANIPVAALKAEREKRQRAEADRKADREHFEREIAALRNQPPQQATYPEAEDFYADPEGYVGQAVQRAQAQSEHRLYAVLDAEARATLPDYDELMEELIPKVNANPALRQQIFSSPNPARAAYALSKQLRLMDQMQDPVTFEREIEARVRAKIEAETKAKSDAARAIPPDLAGTRSSLSSGQDTGGDPFRELFPG